MVCLKMLKTEKLHVMITVTINKEDLFMENNYNNGEEKQTPQYTDPNGAEGNTEESTSASSATTSEESAEDLNQNYQYGTGSYSQNCNDQNCGQGYNAQNYNQSYGNQNANYNWGYNDQNQNCNQGYNNQRYDQNYNMNYNQGMDTSPLSMGQWVLTILAALIPCAGTILYLVWAFSQNGNINRRNYCRAALIIQAVVLLLYLVFAIVFGVALAGAGSVYY